MCFAATEEEIECISKHITGATCLRSNYRFKSAEIKTIARLAGYSEDIAGSDFKVGASLGTGQAADHP